MIGGVEIDSLSLKGITLNISYRLGAKKGKKPYRYGERSFYSNLNN